MRRDAGTLRKATFAHRARERFLAGVRAQVRRKIRCLGKGLATRVTLVRFLSTVCPQVRLQSARTCVSLSAYLAEIHLKRNQHRSRPDRVFQNPKIASKHMKRNIVSHLNFIFQLQAPS